MNKPPIDEPTIVSILDTFNLLNEIEEKDDAETIEIEIGYIRAPLIVFLFSEINTHKLFLMEFCEFIEEKAKTVNDPYELKKINEFLELKPLIEKIKLRDTTENEIGGVANG